MEENKVEEVNELDAALAGESEAPAEMPVAEEKVEEAPAEMPVAVSSKKVGIQNTKELIQLGAAAAKVVREAKQNDGMYSVNDLPLLMQMFPVMGPALDDVSEVPKELKDIDAEELKELLSFGAAHIGGAYSDSPELLEKVEAALSVGLALANAVKVFTK